MSETPSSPPAGPNAPADAAPAGLDRQIIVLGLVIVSGTIMAILDTTIVNVALETLGRDLSAGLSTIQWAVTGYLLAMGTVIPLTGWAVDRFGGRRVWTTSILLFVLGSALCGTAWNAGSLILFRVVQGLGGGMLMPTGMAILTMAAGPRRMGRVMSIVGVPMLLGPVLGPVLGGWLVEDAGWRWIFLVNVPVGLLALALAWWRVPAGRPSRAAAGLDLRGLALLPPGFVLLIYGLSTASGPAGFGAPATIAWLAAGGTLVALFVAHGIRRGPGALIDVRLFADRTYAAASAGAFLYGTALLGSLLLLPLYFQVARGEGALTAGLLLVAQGLGAAAAMPVGGVVTDRFGAGRVVPLGIVLLVLGTLPFARAGADTSQLALCGALFVRGLGLGCTMMPTMSSALTTLRAAAVPRATSTLNILLQLGGSFGAALFAVVLSRQIAQRLPQVHGPAGGGRAGPVPEQIRERVAPQLADAFGHTFWVALALTSLMIVPALLLPRKGAHARLAREAAKGQEAPGGPPSLGKAGTGDEGGGTPPR